MSSAAASAAALPAGMAVARGVSALRACQQSAAVPFEVRPYAYIEKGGAAASSAALGISQHAVIKTLLFQESETAPPLVLLQHGDASVDTKRLIKELARTRGWHSGGAEDSPLRSDPDELAAPLPAGTKKSKARVFLCPAESAHTHSGYEFGGTSPFGLRNPHLRVFIEASLLQIAPLPVEQIPSREAAAAPAPAASLPASYPLEADHIEQYQREIGEWNSASAAAATAAAVAATSESAASAALDPASPSSVSSVTPAWVLINGGARGTLVSLSVRNIVQILKPIVISVAKYATHAAEAPEAAAGGGCGSGCDSAAAAPPTTQ